MNARVTLGAAALLQDFEAALRRRVEALSRRPRLAFLEFAGSAPSAGSGRKLEACARVGIEAVHCVLDVPPTRSVSETIEEIGHQDSVDAVFVPYPLPPGLDARACFDAIPVAKDVDGMSSVSVARLARGGEAFAPATAQAVLALLDQHGFSVAGRRVIVFHGGEFFVKGLRVLLTRANAIAELVESTASQPSQSLEAGDIVVACGPPGSLRLDPIPPDLVVVDACYGRGRGAVQSVSDSPALAAFAPPVGVIGPLTVACLLENTVNAAGRRLQ